MPMTVQVHGNYLTSFGYAIGGVVNSPKTLTNITFTYNVGDGTIYFDGTGTFTNCNESDNVTDITPPPTTNITLAKASEYSDNVYAVIQNWDKPGPGRG